MFLAVLQSNAIPVATQKRQRLFEAMTAIAPFPLDSVTIPFGFAIGRAPGSEDSTVCDFRHSRTEDGSHGFILDGYLINPSWDELGMKLPSEDPLHDANGSYTLVEWDLNKKNVRVSNDRYGFRAAYYWRSSDSQTLVLASSLRIMRLAVSDLNPDAQGFVEQLLISSTRGGRSLLKGVSRLLPGSVKTLSQVDSEHSNEAIRIPWGDAHQRLSLDEAAVLIAETGLEVVGDWIRHRPVTVSLSGGYDSRFLALLAVAACGKCDAINLGTSEWLDTSLAKRFCKATGAGFVGCAPPDRVSMDEYIASLRLVEHIADYLSPSWILKYGRILSGTRQPILNGFLGGPLTGFSMDWIDTSKSLEFAIGHWYRAVNARNVLAPLLAKLCVGVNVAQLEYGIMRALCDSAAGTTCDHYQCVYETEFAVRQFGFVSLDTYNLFRNFSTVVVPFADQRIIRLFANLRCEHLNGQRAYRHAIKSMDTTQIPYAPTSDELREPVTVQASPRGAIERTFASLFCEFTAFVEENRNSISTLLDVHGLQSYLHDVRMGVSPQHTVPQALMLMNAAILWSDYSAGGTATPSSIQKRSFRP